MSWAESAASQGEINFRWNSPRFCSHFYIFLYAFDGSLEHYDSLLQNFHKQASKKGIKTQKERLLFFCSFLWKLLI